MIAHCTIQNWFKRRANSAATISIPLPIGPSSQSSSSSCGQSMTPHLISPAGSRRMGRNGFVSDRASQGPATPGGRARERNCWQRILTPATLEAPAIIRQDNIRTGRNPGELLVVGLGQAVSRSTCNHLLLTLDLPFVGVSFIVQGSLLRGACAAACNRWQRGQCNPKRLRLPNDHGYIIHENPPGGLQANRESRPRSSELLEPINEFCIS